VPKAVLRVLFTISTLIAALIVAGAGAGGAVADPEDPGNVSETDPSPEAPSPSEPEPTTGLPTVTSPPSIFDIPRNIANQLRDMIGRPLSIFGNGRVPGTHTDGTSSATEPTTEPTTPRKHDKSTRKKEPPAPEVKPTDPVAQAQSPSPTPRASSSVEVTLPFTPPISVPLPSLRVPGYENMRWSLDLTDPFEVYASVSRTLDTVNSLLADAYAPYNPYKPPPPPKPTFRTFDEEPVLDVSGPAGAGGSGGSSPLASTTSQLPVLQAPVLVPPVRAPLPRPAAEAAPHGAQPAQPAPAGTQAAPVAVPAAAGVPAVRGSAPTEPLPPGGNATAMVNPAPREGYPQYLRSARISQVATVALPGLGGLIVLTASGGVIGYRQANSGRYLRTDAARFLQ
jgi:hypothetical protein